MTSSQSKSELRAQLAAAQARIAELERRLADRAEESLVEDARKYRDFYDNSPDMYAVGWPEQDLLLDCNETLARTLGYVREELIGQSASMLFEPASFDRLASVLPQYLASGLAQNLDVQLLCKDGSVLDVLMSATLERGRGDRPALSRVTFHDVTERKRLEAALAASEQQLRLAFEATSDALWDWDIGSGAGTVNDQWYRLHGCEPAGGVAPFEVWSCRLDPEDAEMVMQALTAYLEGRRPDYRVEYRARTRSGEVRWHRSVGRVVARDASGRPTRMVGTDADITELVEKRLQLEEANYLLRLAGKVAEIGIWTWDFATGRIEWDERMHQLFEVPDEVCQSGQYFELWRARLHPDDREEAEAIIAGMQANASSGEQVFRIILPGGRVRFLATAGTVESGHDGQPLRMVGVNRDVTELKQAERLLQDANAELERLVAARTAELQATIAELRRANAGKDAFMAAISHELRTPLMGVLSNSELLEQELHGPLSPGQLKHVAAIRSSGERLLTTVNNVLMYASLVAGKTPVTRYDCCVADLGTAAVKSVLPAVVQKDQRISCVVTPQDLVMECDARAIINILKMLLDNAVKFTEPGGQIEVRMERIEDGLRMSVTDTGIGMTQEEIDGLFRPFSQGDKTLARRFEGVGIGLAYVHKMVELLGGYVQVESAQGSGSCFSVILPASQV